MKELKKQWKVQLKDKRDLLKEMKFDARRMRDVKESPSASYLEAMRSLEVEINHLTKILK